MFLEHAFGCMIQRKEMLTKVVGFLPCVSTSFQHRFAAKKRAISLFLFLIPSLFNAKIVCIPVNYVLTVSINAVSMMFQITRAGNVLLTVSKQKMLFDAPLTYLKCSILASPVCFIHGRVCCQ